MAMGQYHDVDNGRVCERVEEPYKSGFATRTARAAL